MHTGLGEIVSTVRTIDSNGMLTSISYPTLCTQTSIFVLYFIETSNVCWMSLIPVIRRKPCPIMAIPQVSVPLISRPVGSYGEGGTTPP